jgi:hypothetical protein
VFVTGQGGQGDQAQNIQLALQTNLANLAQPAQGQTYVIWLYAADDLAVPLAQDAPDENGGLAGAATIPTELLRGLASFTEVRVSLASTTEVQEAIRQAGEQRSFPPFLGEVVLTGAMPDLGQAQAQGDGQGQGGGQGQGQGGGGQGQGQGDGGAGSP